MSDQHSDPEPRADAPPPAAAVFGTAAERPPEPPFRADRPGGGRIWGWLLTILALLAAGLSAAVIAGAAYVRQTYLQDLPPLPPREMLYAVNRAPGIKFFDRDGGFIAERGPKYGDLVRLDHLPAYVPQAFLAAEDKRFYRHGPIDPWAILRAARANRAAGHVVEGGSTLSQQVAKTLFLSPDQTLKRKIQEAVLAWRLEQMLSKDEVLELYLNRIFFGANTFGLDGAARTYFGKPASRLTLAEASLLAALPKAPSRLALNHDMAGALRRSHLVLSRMAAEGWITPDQLRAARAARPALSASGLSKDGDMGYVLDYATNEVLRLVGPGAPDLVVRLTVDSKLQRAGASIARGVIEGPGRAADASQAALLALSADGAIRAMVGGVDYGESVFNRAVQARRQPGSSFKPLVYAAALERGVVPTDLVVDEPVEVDGWRPQNYGGRYRGEVTVETALAQSINSVAVKLAQEVGGPAIGDLARRFGITTIPANPNLSVALGAYETPLIEMVSAFQVFQQAGDRITPYVVEEIARADGRKLYTHRTASPTPAYDLVRASRMVRMLQTVITSGTGTQAGFGRPAAGKTGTSQNWRDAWFVGFTPDYAAGVWVGNDDDRPMNQVTGGVLPAQIWRSFMAVAHEGLPPRDFDWLVPEEPELDPDAGARSDFYAGLADDFAAAEHDAEAPPDPEPAPPAAEPPAEAAPF